MFNRLRRFAGVLLALALLPAAGGAAQCVDHAQSAHPVESAEDSIDAAQTGAHGHAAHRLTGAEAGRSGTGPATHHQHAPTSPTGDGITVAESLSGVAVAASHGATGERFVAASHVAPDNCCPPPGVPGECSSAMGCSVMSATPDQRSVAPLQPIARVIVADGVQQSPGPSRAPEVPPPRS